MISKGGKFFTGANLRFWEEKTALLADYLATTKTLIAKSSLNDLSEIVNLLNQRQEIIRKINSLDAQGWEMGFDNRNLGNTSADGSLSIPLRIKEIVRKIEYLDNELREKFSSWREELKKELNVNKLTFRTIHTYAQTFINQLTPRFLDLRK